MRSWRLWLGMLLSLLVIATALALSLGSSDSDDDRPNVGPSRQQADATAAGPRLRLSRRSGPAGTAIVVRGTRFAAGWRVRIRFGRVRVKGPRTSRRGAFSRRVKVPSLPSGRQRVKARTGRVSASAVFTVTGSGSGDAARVAAAGDVSCDDVCGQGDTARLVDAIAPDAVLGLGDFQYDTGTLDRFRRFYDPHWGRFKSKTYPVNGGSHDFYGTGDYLTYFNDGGPVRLEPEASYSFDLAAWHFVALNSYCFDRGSCDDRHWTSWLERDLRANRARCTLAFWHEPYWTSPSDHEPQQDLKPWVEILYRAGVDVLLQAHNHAYERFSPQDPEGRRDEAYGIRAFTVGTGGRSHYEYRGVAANSAVRDDQTYGVLELVLRGDGYDWRFVPVAGASFRDSGSGSCHGPRQ